MDQKEIQLYDEFERDYWWFVARRKILFSLLNNNQRSDRKKILDIGCGPGANLSILDRMGFAVGVDTVYENLKFCHNKGVRTLIQANAIELPFGAGVFNVVTALDVLEHVEDDHALLKEIYRVMDEKGTLLVTVPAYQFLFSPYADFGHKRRYLSKELGNRIESAGFKIKRISYFNTLLFPLMLAERMYEKMKKKGEPADVVFNRLPGLLNQIFTGIFSFEEKVISTGVNMPFGGSIFCVALKDE